MKWQDLLCKEGHFVGKVLSSNKIDRFGDIIAKDFIRNDAINKKCECCMIYCIITESALKTKQKIPQKSRKHEKNEPARL